MNGPARICGDHEWVDVTTIDSAEDQELCVRCSEIRVKPRGVIYTCRVSARNGFEPKEPKS